MQFDLTLAWGRLHQPTPDNYCCDYIFSTSEPVSLVLIEIDWIKLSVQYVEYVFTFSWVEIRLMCHCLPSAHDDRK